MKHKTDNIWIGQKDLVQDQEFYPPLTASLILIAPLWQMPHLVCPETEGIS